MSLLKARAMNATYPRNKTMPPRRRRDDFGAKLYRMNHDNSIYGLTRALSEMTATTLLISQRHTFFNTLSRVEFVTVQLMLTR